MIWRVTFGFAGNGEGWSETHLMHDPSSDPASFRISKLVNVAQLRANMLGAPFLINRIRCAAYSSDGANPVPRQSFLIKQIFKPVGQFANAAAEPSVVALQATGRASQQQAPAAFKGNTNQTFLGGPQDDAVDEAGTVFPARTNLGAAFAAWSASLIFNEYGWGASNLIFQSRIDSAVQATNGLVTITTKDPWIPPLIANVTFPARISKINGSRSPLNGQVIVTPSGTATFTTEEVIGIPTPQRGGVLKVYSQLRPFLQYGTLTLQLVTAKHKRGRPFGALRGRALARVRG